jgi:YHS domain-containing protein
MHAALGSGRDAGNPIVHSSHFFLVDRMLEVRGVYDSGDESALQRLLTDVSELGAATTPAATATVGATATGGAGAASQNPVATTAAHAVDPVCNMRVPASAESPHATHGGKAYYFCSETCRDEFLRNPDRYVRPD